MAKSLCELHDIVVPVGRRPETTLSLHRAWEHAEETIRTYTFTASLRESFKRILRGAVSEPTQSWWLQAEYGGGKTHCLAALTALLCSPEDGLWKNLGDADSEDDAKLRELARLFDGRKPFFPVIVNLRGMGGVEGAGDKSLLSVLVEAIREQATAMAPSLRVTSADEWQQWFIDTARPELQRAVSSFVQQQSDMSAEDLLMEDEARFAELVSQFCDDNGLAYPIATTTKDKIFRIYEQLCLGPDASFSGMLFVLDEFAFWQDLHNSPDQKSKDEEVLETIAWTLPQDARIPAKILTLVASQKPNDMVKLHGDRLRQIALLKDNDTDYDLIVSSRVRTLDPGHAPELDEYWHYYRTRFGFARSDEVYFKKVFPFHPLCFSICRRITQRMESARLGINIFADLLGIKEDKDTGPGVAPLLDMARLIAPSDLRVSNSLMVALRSETYQVGLASWEIAREEIAVLELEKDEIEPAQRILDVLFLYYCAYVDTEHYLKPEELAEAALIESSIITNVEQTEVILGVLRQLSQVEFTKEKGARFQPSGQGNPDDVLRREFSKTKQTITAAQIADAWRDALLLTVDQSGGKATLFGSVGLDKVKAQKTELDRVQYGGETVVTDRWISKYGEPCDGVADRHFRVVFLTADHDADKIRKDLQDIRIAVWIPSPLPNVVESAAKDYATLRVLIEKYDHQSGEQADRAREYFGRERRSEILRELLQRQITPYVSGQIITQAGIALVPTNLFGGGTYDKAVSATALELLKSAYTSRDDLIKPGLKMVLDATGFQQVYLGITHSKDIRQAQQSALDNYAVVLGLSKADAPRIFEPSNCSAFRLIDERRDNSGQLRLAELYRDLTRPPYGIPVGAVTLWIMLYTYWKSPAVAVRLAPGSNLRLPSGELLPEGRVLQGQIPNLPWPSNGPKDLSELASAPIVDWNTALAVLKVVSPRAKAVTDQLAVQQEEEDVMRELQVTGEALPKIREGLETIHGTLDAAKDLNSGEHEILMEVAACCGVEHYYELYDQATAGGRSLPAFETLWKQDFTRLKQLSEQAMFIMGCYQYLRDAKVPDDIELALTGKALQAELTYANLSKSPQNIDAIRKRFELFKGQYKIAYQKHHRDVTVARRKLVEEIEAQDPLVKAISLLRQLDDRLGVEGDSTEAVADLASTRQALTPCSRCPNDIPNVDQMALCDCRLMLSDEPATDGVDQALSRVKRAFENRIQTLVATLNACAKQATDDELGELLRKLQLSDLLQSPQNITQDVVDQIIAILDRNKVITVEAGVFRALQSRYPTIAEAQVDELLTTFSELLKQAFEVAHKKAKSGQVQIKL